MGPAAVLPPYAPRIDPARYDRAAEFTPEEGQALAAWQPWQGHGRIKHTLARLHRPLSDVLSDATGSAAERIRTISFVFRVMQRTRTPFWVWDDQRWLALMGVPQPGRPFVRPHLLAVAYQLTGFARLHELERMHSISTTARLVFGGEAYRTELVRLAGALNGIGYKSTSVTNNLPMVLALLMLEARDARLEAFDAALLGRLRERYPPQIAKLAFMVSAGLAALGILESPLPRLQAPTCPQKQSESVDLRWAGWCRRWLRTSTLRPRTRGQNHAWLLRVGLWLREAHPEVTEPGHWTAEVCADFLAAVDRRKVDEWTLATGVPNWTRRAGEPIKASSKKAVIQTVRRFLADCQLWDWAKLRCNPRLHLATPRAIEALAGPNPRAIDDHIWLKLIWASLNLTPADCHARIRYPYEMLRAVAVIWTHAGLRPNEVMRLRVGCAKPQNDDVVDEAGKVTPAGTLCYLHVPPGKAGNAYVKPVAAVVREHAEAWELLRPAQDPVLDERIGERVNLLFQLRSRAVSQHMLHAVVIPMLCAKAGVDKRDSMGAITSHRGRASAVTALASVPQGMTLPELMAWCGHKEPKTTMYYIRVKPTRLAGAFAKADRLSHMAAVLIDHDAVVSGAARDGAPYKYYDLGDSYCTNAFWSTCPHRMACAGCSFNVPKASAKAAALAARASVTRMLEEVQLSPDERAAAEGDTAKLDGLIAKLRDTPALDGRTPREMSRYASTNGDEGENSHRLQGGVPRPPHRNT